jgi:hypothetical protein
MLEVEFYGGIPSGLTGTGVSGGRSDFNAQVQANSGLAISSGRGSSMSMYYMQTQRSSQYNNLNQHTAFRTHAMVSDPLDAVLPSDPQVTSDVNARFEERNSHVEASPYPYHPQQVMSYPFCWGFLLFSRPRCIPFLFFRASANPCCTSRRILGVANMGF